MSHNAVVKVEGHIVTVTIDISAKAVSGAPMSKSGAKKLVASTGAGEPIDGLKGSRLALNLMVDPDAVGVANGNGKKAARR
jgi:hypothetical protein